MNEWMELLFGLIGVSLFLNWRYETNYLLQSIMLLMVLWAGTTSIVNAPDFTVYALSLMVIHTTLNIMYIAQHLKTKNEKHI